MKLVENQYSLFFYFYFYRVIPILYLRSWIHQVWPYDLPKTKAVPPVAKLVRFDTHNSNVAHVVYGPTYNRIEDHFS